MEVVSEEWLRRHISRGEALQAVRIAFQKLAGGEVTMPPVQQLAFPTGETCIKSAHLQGSKTYCIKVASGFYNNPEVGLPSGSGLMLVLDAQTGVPLNVLADGGFLTDLRTGAAGALAVDLLAPKRRLSRVAIIGSGTQARFQLRALSAVRKWDVVAVFSKTVGHLKKFCEEMSAEFGLPVLACQSVESCVRGAELVVTTTPSDEPLVRGAWLPLRAGCTLVCMGSDTPGKRELAGDVLERASLVVCDSKAQCVLLGELQHTSENGRIRREAVELGQVVAGHHPGRQHDEDIVVVDLTGVGAQAGR